MKANLLKILKNETTDAGNNRREFLKKAGLGGLSLAFIMNGKVEAQVGHLTQNVNRYSSPSDLKITDLRVAMIDRPPLPLIKIETNQGKYGLGEVRDHGSPTYALMLKSRILGMNPCNIEEVFRAIKQFGNHGRQGGGVSGIEMALWDLAGKAYNIPVYQLLGGKFRDKIRIYADTPKSLDPAVYAKRMKERKDAGFTFLKMDFGIEMIKDIPGALINADAHDFSKQWTTIPGSYGVTEHPFTRIQITDKGIDKLVEYVAAVRDAIGYEIPLASDHYGHIGVNSCIRLGNALEPYRLAWLEDMIPWKYTELWKQITEAINTPTITGEDIYLKEEFIKLIDNHAVEMVHPDLASSGGILETKKIGDYAEEKGVPMAMHFAGSPVSFMANLHCAAATNNVVALEHHSVDLPWWEDMVSGIEKPIVSEGYARVPDKPGLGVDLNEDVIRPHLREGSGYFEPTPQWDKERSWDRTWS